MCARSPSDGHDIQSGLQLIPARFWVAGADGDVLADQVDTLYVWFSPSLLQPVNTDCVDESPSWRRVSEATAALGLPGYASVCVNAS